MTGQFIEANFELMKICLCYFEPVFLNLFVPIPAFEVMSFLEISLISPEVL